MSQTVFITGATDGIGLALARRYAARGARLVLLGRRPRHDLDGTLFTPDRYLRVDLAAADAAGQAVTFLRRVGIDELDLLIHNAGTGYYGPLEQQDEAQIDQTLAVNLYAPLALTHVLLPHLHRARGQLVFVSSVSSVLPLPEYAVYTATKAAIDGFARSLRIELAGAVQVQLIHPGATRTGMHQKLGISTETMDWRRFTPADRVAEQMMEEIERGRAQATIGTANRLVRFAGQYARPVVDTALRLQRRGPSTTPPPSHAAITGAADGIGWALARRFAAAGYAITGFDVDDARAARAEADLRSRGSEAVFHHADLLTMDGQRAAVAALAGAPPGILIHNAGISAVGRFAQMPWAEQARVLDLNLRTPLQMTARLLAQQALAPGAGVIFLSSLSHFTGYPGAAVYAASKDGLFAYARCLDLALASRGGRTLTVFPGPTRTAHARRYSPDNSRESRRMPPEKVAAAVFDAYRRRRRRVVPGAANKMLATLGRAAPRLAEAAMKRAILAPLDASGVSAGGVSTGGVSAGDVRAGDDAASQ